MKFRSFIANTFVFLMCLLLIACSQKLPAVSSNDKGVLVIPHEAFNDTGIEKFGYNYILKYSPETDAEIKIVPRLNNDFIIIDNFPAGKYRINRIISKGLKFDRAAPAFNSKREIRYYGVSFEIKPGHVTLLKSKFVVTKKTDTGTTWRQDWKFKFLDQESKTKLIDKLEKMGNFGSWKLNY